MPTASQRALANAAKSQARNAGVAIIYRAGKIEITIPDAVLGATTFEASDETGAKIRMQMTDWLVFVSRLVHNNQSIEPAKGHRIETTSTPKRVFEVVPLGEDSCWRFAGPVLDRLRIHCQEIAVP